MDQLQQELRRLRSVQGVEGAALLSRDGLTVAAELPPSYNRETFSAMTAALVAASETAFQEAGRGPAERILIENRTTRVLAMGVTDELVLVLVGARELDPSTLGHAVENALGTVRRVMQG